KSQLRLDVGSTRIVVLGKANISRTEEESAFAVSEEALADRVIEEFVAKNKGILSAYALLGMAAIRRNSQRILGTFNSDLDGAFLLHRAFLLHNEDGFDEVPSLLADEFGAIVADVCDALGPMDGVVGDATGVLQIADPEPSWKDANGKDVAFAPIARGL